MVPLQLHGRVILLTGGEENRDGRKKTLSFQLRGRWNLIVWKGTHPHYHPFPLSTLLAVLLCHLAAVWPMAAGYLLMCNLLAGWPLPSFSKKSFLILFMFTRLIHGAAQLRSTDLLSPMFSHKVPHKCTLRHRCVTTSHEIPPEDFTGQRDGSRMQILSKLFTPFSR